MCTSTLLPQSGWKDSDDVTPHNRHEATLLECGLHVPEFRTSAGETTFHKHFTHLRFHPSGAICAELNGCKSWGFDDAKNCLAVLFDDELRWIDGRFLKTELSKIDPRVGSLRWVVAGLSWCTCTVDRVLAYKFKHTLSVL